VVLLVPVVLECAVVEKVESSHANSGELQHGGDATVLGQLVLVVPPPVSPGDGTAVCNGVVELAAKQPSWELVDFHLAQRQILLAIEDCWIIRSMNSLVVFRGQVAKHHPEV